MILEFSKTSSYEEYFINGCRRGYQKWPGNYGILNFYSKQLIIVHGADWIPPTLYYKNFSFTMSYYFSGLKYCDNTIIDLGIECRMIL